MVIRERLCGECELWSIPPTNGEDKRTRDDELGKLYLSMGLTAPGEGDLHRGPDSGTTICNNYREAAWFLLGVSEAWL